MTHAAIADLILKVRTQTTPECEEIVFERRGQGYGPHHAVTEVFYRAQIEEVRLLNPHEFQPHVETPSQDFFAQGIGPYLLILAMKAAIYPFVFLWEWIDEEGWQLRPLDDEAFETLFIERTDLFRLAGVIP